MFITQQREIWLHKGSNIESKKYNQKTKHISMRGITTDEKISHSYDKHKHEDKKG